MIDDAAALILCGFGLVFLMLGARMQNGWSAIKWSGILAAAIGGMILVWMILGDAVIASRTDFLRAIAGFAVFGAFSAVVGIASRRAFAAVSRISSFNRRQSP